MDVFGGDIKVSWVLVARPQKLLWAIRLDFDRSAQFFLLKFDLAYMGDWTET